MVFFELVHPLFIAQDDIIMPVQVVSVRFFAYHRFVIFLRAEAHGFLQIIEHRCFFFELFYFDRDIIGKIDTIEQI